MDLLEVDNIELKFKSKSILDAIYIKAEKGKITGLIGSNGTGKSSLMKIIFGNLIPNNKISLLPDDIVTVNTYPYRKENKFYSI